MRRKILPPQIIWDGPYGAGLDSTDLEGSIFRAPQWSYSAPKHVTLEKLIGQLQGRFGPGTEAKDWLQYDSYLKLTGLRVGDRVYRVGSCSKELYEAWPDGLRRIP